MQQILSSVVAKCILKFQPILNIMAVKEDFREVEALRHKLRQTLKTTDWKLQVWNLTKLGYLCETDRM